MTSNAYDEIAASFQNGGAQAALDDLAAKLRGEERFHELCDTLLMSARLKLGLPIIMTQPLDDLRDPARTQMENACIEIYREVGTLLLRAGKIREAWMYLRPVGERAEVARELAQLTPTGENIESLLELAIHEGVAPRWGFELLLRERGLCNAITMYDGVMAQRSARDRRDVASLLVGFIYQELVRNLKGDITRRKGTTPTEDTVAGLIQDRAWLFEELNYHVDASHLSAVIRFALALDDPADLRKAVQLADYGRLLNAQYKYPGHAPFEDVYPSHGLFFRAQLGEQVDEALAYFRKLAEEAEPELDGTEPAEVYVALLARLKRFDEALEAAAKLLPRGARLTGFAPSILELGHLAGKNGRLAQICQAREDLVGYVAGLFRRRSDLAIRWAAGVERTRSPPEARS
jgi:hypothetical protein